MQIRSMLQEATIKRLTLVRYFFRLADDNAQSEKEVAIFTAINLLQDSIEFFLLAAAEHLHAHVRERATMEGLLDGVNERLTTKLPFRAKLLQLNKVRVNAKHYGVRPDANEVKSMILVVREFFEEVTRTIFNVDFWTISLLSLLREGETRTLLEAAQAAFERRDYVDVLIDCRKAFYLEFESKFDVRRFENTETPDPMVAAFSSAPW